MPALVFRDGITSDSKQRDLLAALEQIRLCCDAGDLAHTTENCRHAWNGWFDAYQQALALITAAPEILPLLVYAFHGVELGNPRDWEWWAKHSRDELRHFIDALRDLGGAV